MFQPHFHMTPAITKALMDIEACRQAIADLPLTVAMLAALRETARLIATHYSTQIEGNRLTLTQVHTVIRGGGHFPGRERNAREVQHYYQPWAKSKPSYYDGNGRTARLLTTLILHRHGYGLKGVYALEGYYAQNLYGYYDALSVWGRAHN